MSPFKSSVVKGGSSKGKEPIIDVDAPLLVERAVDQPSLRDTNIPIWFATKDWNFLLSTLENAYENMVKEF